jgi:hypothetical protein
MRFHPHPEMTKPEKSATRGKPMQSHSMMKLSIFPALFLALCLAVPAQAAREWRRSNTDGTWTLYNYLNFNRFATQGEQEWGGPYAFCAGCTTQRYFQNYVTNYTTEAQCYEVEIRAPENYPTATVGVSFYFWDNAAQKWTDLLGFARKGKARVYLMNSEFPIYIAQYSFNLPHAGYYLSRRALTETQCTSGQNTMNWVKMINGVMTKYVIAR